MFALMIVVFVLGYISIVLEHKLKINKAAFAIILGSVMWMLLVAGETAILNRTDESGNLVNKEWAAFSAEQQDDSAATMTRFIIQKESLVHLGDTAEILFFLMGAMTIVALIDKHNGFSLITRKITTKSKVKLIWALSLLSFFMSALLDNMTTTIVMVTLLHKLVEDKHLRWIYAGMIVIAANAGGAWSPIGDVTTIMLWIGGQITASKIVLGILLPSLISLLVPLIIVSFMLKGDLVRPESESAGTPGDHISMRLKRFTLIWGCFSLICVPILKAILHVPPYMGMLCMLGIFWIITDVIHRDKKSKAPDKITVSRILTVIDTPTILFFLGILTAVAALQTAGHLTAMSTWLDSEVGNPYGIGLFIGVISSIIDNVPLVAGAIGMYPIEAADAVGYAQNFVQDGVFWEFLAYCAGTGGSILIIGSAAGVAAMGLEKIDFMWYLKHISWLALLGYLAGALYYWLEKTVLFC